MVCFALWVCRDCDYDYDVGAIGKILVMRRNIKTAKNAGVDDKDYRLLLLVV